MDYTNLDTLKLYADITLATDDDLLEDIISAASRAMDNFCGRVLVVSGHTTRSFSQTVNPENFAGQTLILDKDLADEADTITGSPTVTYIPRDPPYHAIYNESSSWGTDVDIAGPWGYYTISGQHPVIESTCLRLSKWLYELRQTTRGDAVVSTPEGLVLLPATLPADVMALLESYRRVRLGY